MSDAVALMPNRNNKWKRHVRRRMYKRQKGLCWICGERMSIAPEHAGSDHFATFDHLVPKVEGGTKEQSNLRLAHQKCNGRRSALPVVNTILVMVQV
jgi:5-methylcytosine-specific restriction endonuclease McrA